MCNRPMSTMTGEPEGNREPMTTKESSAAQKTRIRVRRVSGGRPNRGVGLFCARSIRRFNDCLFRLGDIGFGPCREQGQRRVPFLALDPGLPKDAHQQAATD